MEAKLQALALSEQTPAKRRNTDLWSEAARYAKRLCGF